MTTPPTLLLLSLLVSQAALSAEHFTLTATHALPIARPAEMIAVPLRRIIQALPGAQPRKLAVKDSAGHLLPYQVTADGELLFQHDFAAGERSATFTVEKTAADAPAFPVKTFARFVPERLDDFAWENDRVGHRTYGPALAAPDTAHTGKEVLVTSGIDVWSKRVRYPVIDRWYAKGHYHRDEGEGMDMYNVHTSRGTGGTGVWDGKRLYASRNYASWKVLANGPIRSVFELTYAPWEANGVKVSEVKRFTVDAGHNLDLVESTFRIEGADSVTVAIGINKDSADKGQALGAQVERKAADGSLLQWEAQKSNGALGEAIVLPAAFSGFADDAENQLILAKAVSGQPLRYLAGAAWTGSGDFASKADWSAYVAAEAARARAPVTVSYPPAAAEAPMADIVRADIDFAAAQYGYLLDQVKGKSGFPRTVEDGKLRMVDVRDWTAGFFAGSLWYLSEASGDAKWRSAAAAQTAAMEPAKLDRSTHDLGFMLYNSYGNGLRLTGDAAYRAVLLTGADSLITRFNPKAGVIQSWNVGNRPGWTFPVIIDNMMNLEFLMWASRASGNPRYREIAIAHADTTLKNHFRPDDSSYHVVDYDPATGAVRGRVTAQGKADESAWARGQSWGLYGYTMMYRETKKPEYLAQARKIAAFLIGHPRLPADKVPYWDFDDPAIPDVPRDASAAAIMASALLELRNYVDADSAQQYTAIAEQQLRSLSTPAYLAKVGENGGFLLKHSTGHKPAGKEIDVPINYADYYFLEALLRYKAAGMK